MNAHAGMIEGTRLDDPIFEALETYRVRLAASDRSALELDGAESALWGVAPRRPDAIVRYGNRDCGSAQELEEDRDRMLAAARLDPDQVERGYRTVRQKFAEALRAERAWDRQWGISGLRRKASEASRAATDAELELAAITPTTMGGIVSLIEQILAEEHYGLEAASEWGIRALENIAAALPQEAVRVAA